VAALAHCWVAVCPITPVPEHHRTSRLPTLDALQPLQDSRTPPGTLASQQNEKNEPNEERERERERELCLSRESIRGLGAARRFVPRIKTSVILSSLILSNSEMFDNLVDRSVFLWAFWSKYIFNLMFSNECVRYLNAKKNSEILKLRNIFQI